MRKIVAVTVLAVVVGMGLVGQAWTAGAAQATTFHKTIIGTDFHTLDHNLGVQFVPDTGGGVYLYGEFHYPGAYLESNVDLPINAKITRVIIFYFDCSRASAEATWYFGAYNPNAGFDYLAPSKSALTGSIRDSCPPGQLALVPTGSVVVKGTLRYVVGMATDRSQYGAVSRSPSPMVRGARVDYTCPTKCHP